MYNTAMIHKGSPVKQFVSQKELEDWLSKNFEQQTGVWVKFAKKGSGVTTVNYAEALDVALCYGWIDGLVNSLDEKFYLQKFTPRRAKSNWSKINKEHVARLIKEKRMQPAGLLQVEAAKKDGRWDAAYNSPKTMVIPQDFLNLLSKNKKAEEFYRTLNKTNTYFISFQLATAKKSETREKRMQKIIGMLERGEKFY